VFFYPVPTGGALYGIFLDANDSFGDRAQIERAMDLAGVKTAYYVVSYYWWDARRITVGAAKEADAKWNVRERNYVFKYLRK
jgi:hypothetical protein